MNRVAFAIVVLARTRAAADPSALRCSVAGGAYATLSYWEGAFRSRFPYAGRDSNGNFAIMEKTSIDEAHIERLEVGGEVRLCMHDEPGIGVRLGVEANRVGFSSSEQLSGFDLEGNAPIARGWRVGIRGAYLPFQSLQGAPKMIAAGVRARYGFAVIDLAVLHTGAADAYLPPGIDESTWGFFVGIGVDALAITRQ